MAVNIKKLESYFLECISDEVNYVNDWVNSGWVGTFNLDMVLTQAIWEGASDIHIVGGQEVRFTVLGDIVTRPEFEIPDEDTMIDLVTGMLNHEANGHFVKDLEYDTSYKIRFGPCKGGRFRVNIGKSFGYNMMTLRTISDEIPSMDKLGIGPEMSDLFHASSGITLVCGPTGSGKALHINTKIPTRNGFKLLKDIHVGEIIYDENGRETTVLKRYFPKNSERFFNFELSDGPTISNADCHLWTVRIDNRVRTEEAGVIYEEWLKGKDIYIDRTEPVNYPKQELNIDPYYYGTLLGYYSNEKKNIDGVLDNFLYNSVDNRLELLSGYIDTSCEITTNGILFKTSSGSLINSLRILCSSMGWKVEKELYLFGEYEFYVFPTIELPLRNLNKRLKLKVYDKEPYRIDRIYPIEGIWSDYICLAVDSPNHLFLCSEEYVPTHNTNSLASIMRDIQLNQSKKIITVENPIEFVYPQDGKGLVVQRAIPEDCLSFGDGLTSAMRSAPNIILIGEVRNRKEVDELLRASETGHLAVSTIHTSNNVTTLNRIRSLYEGDEQRRILATLGDNLRGIVNQTLVKSVDGHSRFAVREILQVDFKIRKMIQEDRIAEIRKLQEEEFSTMEHKLIDCVLMGKCTYEMAISKAPDPTYLEFLWKEYGEERYDNTRELREAYWKEKEIEAQQKAEDEPEYIGDEDLNLDFIEDDYEEDEIVERKHIGEEANLQPFEFKLSSELEDEDDYLDSNIDNSKHNNSNYSNNNYSNSTVKSDDEGFDVSDLF